jgi:hypothetical protein
MWLTVGAVIGWFANRMIEVERRQIHKAIMVEHENAE